MFVDLFPKRKNGFNPGANAIMFNYFSLKINTETSYPILDKVLSDESVSRRVPLKQVRLHNLHRFPNCAFVHRVSDRRNGC